MMDATGEKMFGGSEMCLFFKNISRPLRGDALSDVIVHPRARTLAWSICRASGHPEVAMLKETRRLPQRTGGTSCLVSS